jgi:hypothetical protein
MSDAAPTGAEPPSKNALKKAQKEKEKVSRNPLPFKFIMLTIA